MAVFHVRDTVLVMDDAEFPNYPVLAEAMAEELENGYRRVAADLLLEADIRAETDIHVAVSESGFGLSVHADGIDPKDAAALTRIFIGRATPLRVRALAALHGKSVSTDVRGRFGFAEADSAADCTMSDTRRSF